jgi:hypothetical protein
MLLKNIDEKRKSEISAFAMLSPALQGRGRHNRGKKEEVACSAADH